MTAARYIAITGGIGGAKLALGLSRILAADDLAFVVNTGDDFEYLGLHISPDIDTLLYTLADVGNTETGWGRRDESWHFMSTLADLGGECWFRLGDKDLALNVLRTQLLNAGDSLDDVTMRLADSLGVDHAILPMSNDPVRTRVQTLSGVLDFQHYFVRERCEPVVTGIEYAGAEQAHLNPEILERLQSAELRGVILCPSNPFLSIDPILALQDLRDRLSSLSVPVIAVSPIVGGEAVKGPLTKMMREMSLPANAGWVAEHYDDFLDGFVLDAKDEALQDEITALGLTPAIANTVMVTLEDRVQLARACVEFIERLREGQRTGISTSG